MGSFSFAANRISAWKSAGIFNYFDNSNMNTAGDTSRNSPDLNNDGRMHVCLRGNYFKQNKNVFLIITMLLIFILFTN